MTADDLDFGAKYAAVQIERRLRRILANVVDATGLGISAAACDANKSDVKQAMDGDPGRYVRLGWLYPLLRFASSDDRLAFLGELVAAFDLEVVPRNRRSPERRLLDLEARVRSELGKLGGELVDDERNRP